MFTHGRTSLEKRCKPNVRLLKSQPVTDLTSPSRESVARALMRLRPMTLRERRLARRVEWACSAALVALAVPVLAAVALAVTAAAVITVMPRISG